MAKTLSQRNWFRYTDENADTLSVQVQDVLGKNVDFGFATVNAADAVAGKGLRLRGIYVKHPTDGRVRFLPCGTGVCDAYSVLGYSLNIKDEGDATGATWTKTGRRGERAPSPYDRYPV